MNNTGVIVSPTPIRSYNYDVVKPTGSTNNILPETYILPEEYIPPIHNQYDIGACVSFTMCGCAESKALKDGKVVTYGRGWNYGRNECRNGYKGYGLFPDQALKGIIKIGFVPLHYFPILEESPEILTLANERDDLLDVSVKPSGYANMSYAMDDKMWDSIRQALAIDNSALVIISHDYFRGGSHAVMGIGYTNKKGKNTGRYVTFQNSWGEKWNQDGRDEIPLEYIDEAYVILWDEITLPFTDVKESDWFFDAVKSVYLSGLVSGTTETTFEPKSSFIRGDFAIILSRAINKFEHSMNVFIKTLRQQGKNVSDISFKEWNGGTIPFYDVNSTDYYADAICHVYANDIMNGVSDTEFSPKATITRAEASAICVRLIDKLCKMLEDSTGEHITRPKETYERFDDVAPGSWYEPYVKSACELGIMNGNGDGTFAPEKGILRCEGATILQRLFKLIDEFMMQTVKGDDVKWL